MGCLQHYQCIVAISMAFVLAAEGHGKDCLTYPAGVHGACVPMEDCPRLKNLLGTSLTSGEAEQADARQILRKSVCSFNPTKYTVCCETEETEPLGTSQSFPNTTAMFTGPSNKIWADSQCPVIWSYRYISLSACTALCVNMDGCTAINFSDSPPGTGEGIDGCVLRGCSEPVPLPDWEYPPYQGYALSSAMFTGPFNKIWADSQCPIIESYKKKFFSECTALCVNTVGCTAINFSDSPPGIGPGIYGCVLLDCPVYVPLPDWEYPPYQGYALSSVAGLDDGVTTTPAPVDTYYVDSADEGNCTDVCGERTCHYFGQSHCISNEMECPLGINLNCKCNSYEHCCGVPLQGVHGQRQQRLRPEPVGVNIALEALVAGFDYSVTTTPAPVDIDYVDSADEGNCTDVCGEPACYFGQSYCTSNDMECPSGINLYCTCNIYEHCCGVPFRG